MRLESTTVGSCPRDCPCEEMQANIEDRDWTESRLRRSQTHLALAQEIAAVGSWDWDVCADEVHCSPELKRIYGLPPPGLPLSFEGFMEFAHPEDRRGLSAAIRACCARTAPFSYYHRITRPDGDIRSIYGKARIVAGSDDSAVHVAGTSQDVTERIATERVLAAQAEELRRSNKELRQFAYVASHDLQEPLRTVASFTRLLQKRYAGRLDAEADELIDFAADGAKRMQALIESLLSYFRVERRSLVLRPVDSGKVLRDALLDLHAVIAESGTRVTWSELPVVRADPALLGELFQNLIGNAVKYRSGRPPRVRVSALRAGRTWTFAVQDNGIGIDPRHHERIFEIFQRLHTREEYPGTGIGLSIGRKIVERHGGRIWVESAAGRGAAFRFSVPDEAPEARATKEEPLAVPEGR